MAVGMGILIKGELESPSILRAPLYNQDFQNWCWEHCYPVAVN